ncbi:MAG: iron chelate uptake ABC transporter family permease subunit [Aeromicrobium sp.]|uniref:FecCD family ABC transporter permease n=1 Tax=Aeromicrobium sp. TaxID=1871063 RepID=UPI0039E3F563
MATTVAAPTARGGRSGLTRSMALIVLGAVLVGISLLSLFVGSGDISAGEAWRALWHNDHSTNAEIVRTTRVPRMLLGLLAGAALGVAGALMQALTRNPLADPGLLGVNAGAYLAMVLGFWIGGAMSTAAYALFAMAGAFVASGLVYFVGSRGRGGVSPGKLVLTGVAVSCVFTGLAFGLTMIDPKSFDAIRGWQMGTLQKSNGEAIFFGALPYVVVGLVVAVALTLYLNAIALGDDRARALGVPVTTVRTVGFVAMTLLCGAATAAIGPISFLGLMVPHAVRAIVGPDQRWIIPACLLASPILFLGADVIGRVATPGELPVGMVTAFIGAPVLIWLARGRGVNEL